MTSTFKPRPMPRIASDEQIQEDFQRSRIYRAIRKGDSARVLSAIYRGANINLYNHDDHTTYLHLVVTMANPNTEDKFLPMVYILSNYGIEINAQDIRGKTALELAIDRGLRYIMVALIRVGIDLTDRDYKSFIQRIQGPYQPEMLDNFEKFEPGLWGAVKRNDIAQTQLLLNSWCRVNTLKNNKTPIKYAILTRKSDELVTVLRESETNLEFVHATLAGDEKLMQDLLDLGGCDPHTMDISHHDPETDMLFPRSLRDTAIAMGHTHVLHLLPESEESDGEQTQEFSDLYDDDLRQNNAVFNDDTPYNGHYYADVDNHRYDDYVVIDKDENGGSPSEYSESIVTSHDITPPPRLRLDLSKLTIDDEEEERDDFHMSDPYLQHARVSQQQQQIPQTSSRKSGAKKYRNRFYLNGDAGSSKKGPNYAKDEGYNSTVSSVQSVSKIGGLDSSPDHNRKTQDTSERFGRYKQYYDNCYYYTTANGDEEDDETPAMLVLTTPRGGPGSQPLKGGSIRGGATKKGSIKGGSVKTGKKTKQRSRIYWQEDSAGEPTAAPLDRPVPKPRKSKRSKSLRLSKHRSERDEDDDGVKSKMCVIS